VGINDSASKEALPVKSFMLALWDQNYKNTLRIDLWTKICRLMNETLFL